MKKIYLFLIFFLITGCSSGFLQKSTLIKIDCPTILFSSQHKSFVNSSSNEITLDNIDYKADLNNAIFSNYCSIDESTSNFIADLSVLFIVKPLNQNQQMIKLPFYIAIINGNKDILNIDYFLAEGIFKKNLEVGNLIETDITKKVKIKNKITNEKISIVIGFIIEDKKLEILN